MKKIFHYEIKSLLGIGAFSNVFLAYDTKNKINVAIKRIQKDLNHAQDYKDFYKEIKSMSEIQSNHSVKFYDAFQKDEYYYIVSELCDENFENYLENFPDGLDNYTIRDILLELNQVFEKMNELNIIHGDLNPKNILIKYYSNNKNYFKVKLCDYSLGKKLTELGNSDFDLISKYKSPEIIKALQKNKIPKFNQKSDLWSLGVLIYFMKFKEIPVNEFYNYIIPKKFDDSLLEDLIKNLICEEKKRFNWNEYLNHPFFYVKVNQIILNDNINNSNSNHKIHQDKSFDFNNNVNKIKLYKSLDIQAFSYDSNSQYCIFTSVFGDYLLIYIKPDKFSLGCYDLKKNIIIKELINIHSSNINCVRHYERKQNDFIISSSLDNTIKVFNISKNWSCVTLIENVGDKKHKNGGYYILSILMFSDLYKSYILSSNYCDNYLKLYNLKGKFIKNICNNEENIEYINLFYDKNFKYNFIIICKFQKVKSYIFEKNIEYKTYSNADAKNFILHIIKNVACLFISNNNSINIFNFHSGEEIFHFVLIDKIKINSLLLWNENFLLVAGNDSKIHIIDFMNNIESYTLEGHNNEVLKLAKIKIENQEYLVSQGLNNDGIKLWK